MLAEKILQKPSTFALEHPSAHLRTVGQSSIPNDVPQRPDGPGFGFPRAENDARNTGEDQSAGTHRAGFEGDGERRTFQTPTVAVDACGSPQGQNLGMCGGIGRRFTRIGRASNLDAVGIEDHGAHGNICVRRTECSIDGYTDHALIVSERHLPRKFVERSREFGFESESLSDHRQLLVRVQIGVGRDNCEDGFRQPQIRQD